MNLLAAILQEHSKAQCNSIVQWIGKDPARFDLLVKLFVSGPYKVTQRAAWPLSVCVQAHPELMGPHFEQLVPFAGKAGLHPAIRRNIIRLLQSVDIPEPFQGTLMDLCFRFINDPREKPAVKAFSLTVLDNLANLYPEIRPEIVGVIRENWERESPAFKSRARKILEKRG